MTAQTLKALAQQRLTAIREMEQAGEQARNRGSRQLDSSASSCSTVPPARGMEQRNKEPTGYPPPDLSYLLRDVEQRLPRLTPGHREVFDYWLEAYEDNGWSREEAERGAFAQTMGQGPIRLKAMGIWGDFPDESTT